MAASMRCSGGLPRLVEDLVERAGEEIVQVVGMQLRGVTVQADPGDARAPVGGDLGVAVAVRGMELAGMGGAGGGTYTVAEPGHLLGDEPQTCDQLVLIEVAHSSHLSGHGTVSWWRRRWQAVSWRGRSGSV
jgi:hypothetical protein